MPTVLSTATIITHSHQSPLCEPRPGHQMLCEKHCYKYSSIKCISHHHCQNRFHAAYFFSVISNLKSYLCASDWQSLGHMHVSLMQKQLKKQVSGLYSETLLIRKDIPKHMKRGKDVGKKLSRYQRYQRCENITVDSPGVSAHWQLRKRPLPFAVSPWFEPASLSSLLLLCSSHHPHWSLLALQGAELLQL